MIKCEICKKRQAKLHITQIKNNQKFTLHVCHECAHENGIAGPTINTSFSIEGYLSGYVKPKQESGELHHEADVQLTCPNCGLSYSAFKESGRLGCSHCYEVFTEQLKPLLQKVQKDSRHIGKAPYSDNTQIMIKRNISDLRTRLQEAVRQEHFEDAARLRDQIRQLEGELSRISDEH